MIKFKGTYVFKQNGKEIGRSNNLITTNGTNAILKYLSGHSGDWASSIAIGAMNNNPTVDDLALTYEIARSAVTLKSYKNGTPNLIIVKGQIDPLVAANIYEVGIFPSNTDKVFGERDKLILTDFSTPADWIMTSTGTTVTQNPYQGQNPFSPRVGLYSLTLGTGTTVTNNNFLFNAISYTSLDTLDVLVSVDPAKSGTLVVKLTDVNGNQIQLNYPYDGNVSSGYQILSLNFPSAINTLSSISEITLTTVGLNCDITVDAIRVSILNEISESTAIISRSVLDTPIAKLYAVPLDIEYYLQLG
jgi:hypothetical protein